MRWREIKEREAKLLRDAKIARIAAASKPPAAHGGEKRRV